MNAPPSPSTEIRMLTDLFTSSFQTAAAMRGFIRSVEELSEIGPDLPSDNVSARKMADDLAEHMLRRGLVTKEFFQRLAEIRPGHVDMITRAVENFGFVLDPIQPRLAQDLSTIILDPEGSGLMILQIVGRMIGRSWAIALSQHRVAKYAARDIFAAILLGDDTMMVKVMFNDEYRLCQGARCFSREVIGRVINPSLPVHIERRQRYFVYLDRA